MAKCGPSPSGVVVSKDEWMRATEASRRKLGWRVVVTVNDVVSSVRSMGKRISAMERKLSELEQCVKAESEVVSDVPPQRKAHERGVRRNGCLTMWFVDSENVGKSWVRPVGRELDKGDVVHYLFTKNSPEVPEAAREMCRRSGATLVQDSCTCEQKNALDFQLVSALSMEAARHGRAWRYRVVSCDRGFTAATSYLSDCGLDAAVFVPSTV